MIVRRAASGQSPAGEPMRALAADIDALAEQLSERERGVVARYLADVAAAVERRSAGALPGAGAAPT